MATDMEIDMEEIDMEIDIEIDMEIIMETMNMEMKTMDVSIILVHYYNHSVMELFLHKNFISADECPKLSDPANGDVEITGVNPGDRATYQCDNGHDLVGSSSRKCQQNGQWSGEAPICKR